MGKAVAAVTSVASGVGQGYLANKQRQAAGQAYNKGINSLEDSQSQALGYLDPYRQAGQTALSPLTGLLTGNQYDPNTGQTTSLTPEQRDNLLYQSPGYRFAVQQGQQGLERNQIANGYSLSGGAQKELAQYLSGAASQYSGDYINQLAGLAGIGQNAANNSASTVTNFAPEIAGYKTNQGLTRANYYAQLGNIVGGTGSSLSGLAAGQSSGGGGGNGLGGFGSFGGSPSGTNTGNTDFMSAGGNALSGSTSLTSQFPIIAG
jgi:hypothetical protein